MNPVSPTRRTSLIGALALGAALTLSSAAHAEPLVTMKGGDAQPGVVTEWSGSGKKVTLSVKDGADAAAVAEAIESGVDRVRVKVSGGKILVIGKAQDELLSALAGVDFGAGGGDLDLLASAGLDEGIDSGSSLRAKKTGDLKKLFKDRATVAQGTVAAVKTGAFPKVIVSVRILSGPTGALGKSIRKGQTISFVPTFEMKGGQLNLTHTETQTNIGAYFLQKGDRVKVKVGKALKGGYEAVVLTR